MLYYYDKPNQSNHYCTVRSSCWSLLAHVRHLPPFNSPLKRSATLLDLSFSRSTESYMVEKECNLGKNFEAHMSTPQEWASFVHLWYLTRLSAPPPHLPTSVPQGFLRGHSGVDYLPWTDTADSHFCLTRCLCCWVQFDRAKKTATQMISC